MGKVLTIFSPKGGVGKTTLTEKLGLEAAMELSKVCLVELDFSPGDFAVLFNIEADKTIEDAILDPDNTISYLKKLSGKNLHILLGSLPDRGEKIKQDRLTRVIDTLRQNFDLVVIDTQPCLTETVIDAMNMSDEVLIILEADITVLGRGNTILDYIALNKFSNLQKFKMVINKKRTNLPFKHLSSFKIPIISVIPYLARYRMGTYNQVLAKEARKILKEYFPDKFDQKKKFFGFGG